MLSNFKWLRRYCRIELLPIFFCTSIVGCHNQQPTGQNNPPRTTQPAGDKIQDRVTATQTNKTPVADDDLALTFVLNRPLDTRDLERLKSSQIDTVQLNAGVSPQIAEHWVHQLPRELTQLKIRRLQIDDQLLREILATQPLLTTLNLPSCELTPAVAAEIATLDRLRNLRLGGECFDDAFLGALRPAKSLRSVHLIRPNLTDYSLVILASTRHIKTFYLDECELSDTAWETLFASRPDLHVHIDQQHHDRDTVQD